MKDSFVIYTKYEEQISLLTDTQAGVLLRSLIKYQSRQDVPKMDAVTSMAFSFIKQEMDYENQKYDAVCAVNKANGQLGGRPSKTLRNKREKPKKPSGFESEENKPNGFSENQKNQTVIEESKKTERLLKETTPLTKESSKENTTPVQENISPLFIPPTGEKEKTAEDLFFEKYPRYAKDRAKMRQDVDYKRLTEEFEKSTYLRSLYTVKQINELYALIITGDYRDKKKKEPQADKFAAINAKAERERWYAARKNAAENKADKIRDKFMQSEEFSTIERRLSKIELEAAKESFKAEQGDTKAVKQLVKLEQEKNRLIMQRRNIIERNGKTEEDLLPQWHCKKCSDTGYLPDGRQCDCYNKQKE